MDTLRPVVIKCIRQKPDGTIIIDGKEGIIIALFVGLGYAASKIIPCLSKNSSGTNNKP